MNSRCPPAPPSNVACLSLRDRSPLPLSSARSRALALKHTDDGQETRDQGVGHEFMATVKEQKGSHARVPTLPPVRFSSHTVSTENVKSVDKSHGSTSSSAQASTNSDTAAKTSQLGRSAKHAPTGTSTRFIVCDGSELPMQPPPADTFELAVFDGHADLGDTSPTTRKDNQTCNSGKLTILEPKSGDRGAAQGCQHGGEEAATVSDPVASVLQSEDKATDHERAEKRCNPVRPRVNAAAGTRPLPAHVSKSSTLPATKNTTAGRGDEERYDFFEFLHVTEIERSEEQFNFIEFLQVTNDEHEIDAATEVDTIAPAAANTAARTKFWETMSKTKSQMSDSKTSNSNKKERWNPIALPPHNPPRDGPPRRDVDADTGIKAAAAKRVRTRSCPSVRLDVTVPIPPRKNSDFGSLPSKRNLRAASGASPSPSSSSHSYTAAPASSSALYSDCAQFFVHRPVDLPCTNGCTIGKEDPCKVKHDKLFCIACYQQEFDKVCARCDHRIPHSAAILVDPATMERFFFHQECCTCTSCDVPLRAFEEKKLKNGFHCDACVSNIDAGTAFTTVVSTSSLRFQQLRALFDKVRVK